MCLYIYSKPDINELLNRSDIPSLLKMTRLRTEAVLPHYWLNEYEIEVLGEEGFLCVCVYLCFYTLREYSSIKLNKLEVYR